MAGDGPDGERIAKMFDYGWYSIKDGDARGYDLMTRHYTFRQYADNRRSDPGYRNRHLFVGPGEKVVLMTPDCKALFVWRKFIDDSGQEGINCAVFRNEGPYRSSDLIKMAMAIAWEKWPGERLYTYVDPKQVESGLPGYCFFCARWRMLTEKVDGKKIPVLTKSGKLIFYKLPKRV